MMFNKYENEIYNNIKDEWYNILKSEYCIKLLNNIFKNIDSDLETVDSNNCIEKYMTPKPIDIFKPFTYFPIQKLNLILIGEDPHSEGYNGLCFSRNNTYINNKIIPNIINCIKTTCNIIIENNDIKNWTNNNMLMLNTYLTKCTKNINKSIQKNDDWKLFIFYILKKISEYKKYDNDIICVLLWGDLAQSFEPHINNKKFKILKWTHPAFGKTFEKCNHFKIIQKINGFKFKFNNLYIFTDGACSNNGKTNSKGSHAFYIPEMFTNVHNYYKTVQFVEITEKKEYKYNNKTKQVHSIKILNKLKEIPKVTNSRTEILAAIHALLYIIVNRININYSSIVLVTDSMYVKHQLDGTQGSKANQDLIYILKTISKMIDNITIQHQRSHQKNKKNISNLLSDELLKEELIKNNNIVDKLASNKIK